MRIRLFQDSDISDGHSTQNRVVIFKCDLLVSQPFIVRFPCSRFSKAAGSPGDTSRVIILFAISGFQVRDLLAPSITEVVKVLLKNQDGTCVVEGSDNVPRTITGCQYNVGDTLSITYKPQQPTIERHELRQSAGS